LGLLIIGVETTPFLTGEKSQKLKDKQEVLSPILLMLRERSSKKNILRLTMFLNQKKKMVILFSMGIPLNILECNRE
jgi:hypothetical protein